MASYRFGSIKVNYNTKLRSEITGIATDSEFKFGQYFPVSLQHKKFEVQLYYILWEDGCIEIHPRVVRAEENIQTLHGRLRLSINRITSGSFKNQYVYTLRQAQLKRGVTLHSNLFGAILDELDAMTGYDTYQTLMNFGASEVGTKGDLLNEGGEVETTTVTSLKKMSTTHPLLVFYSPE